jgi:hypothetical protein
MTKFRSDRKISPDLLELIRRQKRLREQLVAWHVIAELAGVSKRAVLKAAASAK